MSALPQPPFGQCLWRHLLYVFIPLSLLGGCGTPNTDFGEVRPSLVHDDIHDWVGSTAIAPHVPSSFELTDDERALRDLAFPLIEPPYDRQRWDNVLREYGLLGNYHPGPFDRTAYAAELSSSRYRSPSSRYAQLADDIRNDVTRMPQFFETVARVIDVDAKRRKSFEFISQLSPDERANAQRRIRENACIVAWVRDSIAHRMASYRFALERLVIMTPSPQAADVEQTLNELHAFSERYRFALPPPHAPRVVWSY